VADTGVLFRISGPSGRVSDKKLPDDDKTAFAFSLQMSRLFPTRQARSDRYDKLHKNHKTAYSGPDIPGPDIPIIGTAITISAY